MPDLSALNMESVSAKGVRQVSAYSFAGIQNFRDFGGIGNLPACKLFRSAHLGGATSSDIEQLQGLDLTAIIDLRRPTERARRPSPTLLADRTVYDVTGDRADAALVEFLQREDSNDEELERFLLEYYRSAPFELRHLNLFTKAFAALAKGPILIHCAAGKDRTGLLAALIQYGHGVHHDDVMTDFLETNNVMFTEINIERARALARKIQGREASKAVIHAILGVRQSHLEAAFTSIRAEAGSLNSYLSQLRQPDLL